MQGRRQAFFFLGGGGASVGVSLRGISLFVGISFLCFLPNNLGKTCIHLRKTLLDLGRTQL